MIDVLTASVHTNTAIHHITAAGIQSKPRQQKHDITHYTALFLPQIAKFWLLDYSYCEHKVQWGIILKVVFVSLAFPIENPNGKMNDPNQILTSKITGIFWKGNEILLFLGSSNSLQISIADVLESV